MSDNLIWKNMELVTSDIKAFVYKITIIKNDQTFYYIGYKVIDDRWKSYISSSKYVKEDRDFIVSKEILEVFTDKKDAFLRECEIIEKLGAVESPEYYNRCLYGKQFNAVGLKQQTRQKKHIDKLNNSPEFKEKFRERNKSDAHLKMLEENRLSKEFIEGREKHRNSSSNKEHLKRIRNSPECIEANRIRINSEENKQFMRDLRNTEQWKEGFCAYKQSQKSKEIDRANVLKAHAANYKKVKNLDTGIIYDSLEQACNETKTPSPTIGRHCRNEVRNPKWVFVDPNKDQ